MSETLTAKREAREVATRSAAQALEQVLIKGDLRDLSEEQRVAYYHRVCESAGLNPLTQPFAYITLNGKLTLYALRTCTDQLRAIHGVSVVDMDKVTQDGVHIVTVKVQDAKGRTDMATGAVAIASLKGEALANALMKTETKAKRRATLSICGLGLLDETEVETIPGAVPGNGHVVNPAPRQRITPKQLEELQQRIDATGSDIALFCDYMRVEALADLTPTGLVAAMAALDAKADAKAKGTGGAK